MLEIARIVPLMESWVRAIRPREPFCAHVAMPDDMEFLAAGPERDSRRLRAGASRCSGARWRDRTGRRAAYRALVRSLHGLYGALNGRCATRVTPTVLSVLDYAKGFGHTDLVAC
jgi:hypothetical protein